MAKVDLNAPASYDADLDKLLYGNLTKADIEKYSFLIDIDINQLKETLQDLTLNYYKYYIKGDAVNFEDTAKELNKYIDLDIPAINDFIRYSFVIAGYSILKTLYDFDLDLYAPSNPGLNIKGFDERKQEQVIKRYGLTPNDAEILQNINKAKVDLWALKDGLDVKEPLKEPVRPEHLENELFYKNTLYYGEWDLKQEMKQFICLDLVYKKNENGKLLKKAVNKPYFDLDKKEVIHND